MQAKKRGGGARNEEKLSHQTYKQRDSFNLSNVWVYFLRRVTTYLP